MEFNRNMTDSIHKTHFTQNREMPWKRPITISYITGLGLRCDVNDCNIEAAYMGGDRICCVQHWINLKDDSARDS